MIYGVFYFIFSALCFTAMHLLVKSCSVSLPSEQLMFWRSVTGLVVLTAVLPFLKQKPVFFGKNTVPLLCRAFFGSVALFAFFKAITLIKVGNATMLCYTYPVFLTVFAAIFLKERFSLKTALLLVVAMAGVVMIIRPKLGVALAGEIIGLSSGIVSGLALLFVVLLRRRGEASFVIVYYFFVAGTALSAVFAPRFVRIPDGTMLVELLAIGACSLLAQLSMTTGYRHLSAAAGGILSLSVVPFTALGAYVFLRETADAFSITGGILVLVAAAVMTYDMEQRRKSGVMRPPG